MDILQLGLKERLWHQMRIDLARWVRDMPTDKLLCPMCARWLKFEQFSVEHVIPKQALDDDPREIKEKLATNERSPLMLLCTAPLKIKVKGEAVPRDAYGQGCNSWKGRVFDGGIRRVLNRRLLKDRHRPVNSRDTIGCLITAHLAFIERFGYQFAISSSGALMRRQFFHPNKFLDDMPVTSQLVLMGDMPMPADDTIPYWRGDASFTMRDGACTAGLRNFSVTLPCSRDPRTPPSGGGLHLLPSKFILRPDLQTIFV